ncbi:MAG: hypothetical protein HQM02_14105, partial [Magnetococcales bacterium]|nr:hypothetical protein [Magnetococcales bacterium]
MSVIRLARQEDGDALEQLLACSPHASFADRREWLQLMQRSYGFDQYTLIHEDHNGINALLNLTRSRHPLLGHYLATAPFFSFGGLLVQDERRETMEALMNAAVKLRDDIGADYLLIKQLLKEREPPPGWQSKPIYATHILDFDLPMKQYWQTRLDQKVRNQTRKSMKQNFTIQFGGRELLEDLWLCLLATMRELGSPF